MCHVRSQIHNKTNCFQTSKFPEGILAAMIVTWRESWYEKNLQWPQFSSDNFNMILVAKLQVINCIVDVISGITKLKIKEKWGKERNWISKWNHYVSKMPGFCQKSHKDKSIKIKMAHTKIKTTQIYLPVSAGGFVL